MRLKLTLQRSPQPVDVLVTVDVTVTVGEIADALQSRDPAGPQALPSSTLRVDSPDGPGRVLAHHLSVSDSSLRSGDTVTVVSDAGDRYTHGGGEKAAAVLHVLEGPDAGRSIPLRRGANQVGREHGNDIILSDPLVSKRHARINVSDTIEILDLGSSNGLLLGDDLVARFVLGPDDTPLLGDTRIRIERLAGGAVSDAEGAVQFNRSPQLDPVYEGRSVEVPEPPRPKERNRFPVIVLLAPVLAGLVLYAITRQAITVLFIALSPLMILGNYVDGKITGGRAYRKAVGAFHRSVVALDADITREATAEATSRRREHPATADVLAAAGQRGPMLWARRPDQRGFLEARLGLGTLPTRSEVVLPRRGEAEEHLWNTLVDLQQRHLTIDQLPIVVAFDRSGSLGIAGAPAQAQATARAVLVNLCGLHSPAELVVAAVGSATSAKAWDWLKWLPHVGSDHSPLSGEHLSAGPGMATRLAAAIDDLLETRSQKASGPQDAPPLPRIVLLVEDDTPVERSRLVDLGERGPAVGIHLLWVAPTLVRLPAVCRTFVELAPNQPGLANVGDVDEAVSLTAAVDQISLDEALRFARGLAPIVDSCAPVDDDSDLPRQVSLVGLLGTGTATDPTSVIDNWTTSRSLPGREPPSPRKTDNTLRAVVGAAGGQPLQLDLRTHGPHALVGGTTGAGKSEFLQSWVMSMAAEHSPARVTFLFVDYKGGSAFGECVNLPHSVGLVTDLTPHLVNRALTSLDAELKYREKVLRDRDAKDLLDLERRLDPDTPPSLVIVVDEFAALVAEVPEFVDGVVNVAQRGRSLGLHLVLATQRPAGVIKDNLRANTNLRIALRVADDDSSLDVIGTNQAANFDPDIPGRGVAKLGPGRLTTFQAGYIGGWTPDEPEPGEVIVQELRFGASTEWPEPPSNTVATPAGPKDLQRLLKTIVTANAMAQLPAPRRPWLDELADIYDLAKLPQTRTDDSLVFGVLDMPEVQRQVPVAFQPDRDGNMAVSGTGGSGKTTLLRTLAISAGRATRSGPCHVYAIDFAGRGLELLTRLPHVGAVVAGDDHERLTRLLRFLLGTIEARAVQFTEAGVDNIGDYRKKAGKPNEPRFLVLVDGMAAFRTAYESGDRVRWLDILTRIATEGRQVGVHLVIAADRPNAIPAAISSAIQRRLVLRMANDQDYAMADVGDAGALEGAPPGRGLLDKVEVQVGVLGVKDKSANGQLQASAIEQLAAEMRGNSERHSPAPIGRLATRVTLGQLPVTVGGLPTLGIADETLAPIGFWTGDPLLVVGPTGSGMTSTLAALTMSQRRACPVPAYLMGSPRSPLWQLPEFDRRVSGEGIRELAEELVAAAEGAGLDADQALVVIEDVSEAIDMGAELIVSELVRACSERGLSLIVGVDSAVAGGYSQLLATLRAKRHGLALQPEQHEGEQLFKVPFPRLSRSEFPPGRGLYVRKGTVSRVQCALPDADG